MALLEETYPGQSKAIQQARLDGLSDEEIQGEIQSFIRDQSRAGQPVERIQRKLGQGQPGTLQQLATGSVGDVAEFGLKVAAAPAQFVAKTLEPFMPFPGLMQALDQGPESLPQVQLPSGETSVDMGALLDPNPRLVSHVFEAAIEGLRKIDPGLSNLVQASMAMGPSIHTAAPGAGAGLRDLIAGRGFPGRTPRAPRTPEEAAREAQTVEAGRRFVQEGPGTLETGGDTATRTPAELAREAEQTRILADAALKQETKPRVEVETGLAKGTEIAAEVEKIKAESAVQPVTPRREVSVEPGAGVPFDTVLQQLGYTKLDIQTIPFRERVRLATERIPKREEPVAPVVDPVVEEAAAPEVFGSDLPVIKKPTGTFDVADEFPSGTGIILKDANGKPVSAIVGGHDIDLNTGATKLMISQLDERGNILEFGDPRNSLKRENGILPDQVDRILFKPPSNRNPGEFLRLIKNQMALQLGKARLEPSAPNVINPTDLRASTKSARSIAEEPAPAIAPEVAAVSLEAESLGSLIKKGFGTETGAIGKLTPEQVLAEADARIARAELFRRARKVASETGKSFEAAAIELGATPAQAFRIANAQKADATGEVIRDSVAFLEGLNERAKITTTQSESVRDTGTLPKESREFFREATGEKPETFQFKISQADVAAGQQRVVDVAANLKTLLDSVERRGDPFSKNLAQFADAQIQQAVKEANAAANRFRKLRFAAGRSVQQFNRAPFSADIIQSLKDAGVTIEGLVQGKERLPIYTNIIRSLKNFDKLAPAERTQLWRDFVDAFRLNLFSTTSFTLDMVGNLSELGAQTMQGLGRDVVHAAKGNPTFPSLQGMFRAIKERKPLPVEVSEQLGRSIGGEKIAGGFAGKQGTFTLREGPASTAVDFTVGTPLYLKGLMDTAARRYSASANLWREAIEGADKAGIKGLDRRAFYDEFFKNPPEKAVNVAVSEGKKAAFDRVLSKFEEEVGRSVTARLLVDAFARWPFQFTRWAGEMLGVNPGLFRKVRAGSVTAEEMGGYLAKSATGIGGLYMINSFLYDNVDFNSMEYVHADGNRTRLSSREPIPSALFLLSVIKGDKEKATGALRHASVPFGKVLVGEGGLLGGIVSQVSAATRNSNRNPRQLQRVFTDLINRAIPGQALLGAVKTVFDPKIREGVGANLPGVSRLLEPVINPATGEPLEPRQEVLGLEIPSFGGTPIPGAKRLLDPTRRLLSRFGMLVYRGPRSPIAGFPPGALPEKNRHEFAELFGRERAKALNAVAPQIEAIERSRGKAVPGSPLFEEIRKELNKIDNKVASDVTKFLNDKYGTLRRLPRQPTLQERRLPGFRQ